MKLITLFNFLCNILILIFFIKKTKPITFEIEKTCWTEKPLYLIVWLRQSSHSYKSIIRIPLCDTKKANDEDTIANKKNKK